MIKSGRQPYFQIGLFVLSLIVCMVAFYFASRELLRTNRARVVVDDLAASRTKLTQLRTILPIYVESSKEWSKSLPATEKDVAAFAEEIEQMAKSAGIKFNLSFDDFPGPVDVTGNYMAGLGAEITLEGSFAGIAGFVNKLTESVYFFKIDKITMTKSEVKNGVRAILNGALMMNLKI